MMMLFNRGLLILALACLAATAPQQAGDKEARQNALQKVMAVLPTAPPRLSPRPVFVEGVATPMLSLDGEWSFSSALLADVSAATGPDTSAWKPIVVPGEWAMQGFDVPPGTAACYARTVDVPADWAGHRIKLRFDSVNSVCRVWLNGQVVGNHEGGFVAFELDVTDAMRAGKNVLCVSVQFESVSDTLGSVSQYAAHPVGGLLRKVELFALPSVNIASEVITTKVAADGGSATLVCNAELAADAGQFAGDVVKIELKAPSGQPVHLSDVTWNADAASHTFSCDIPMPKLWDSEHPNLYTLATTITHNGHTAETITRRVGLREVDVKGNQLLINHKPVKLLGVCRHEVDPLTGRSVSAATCRRDAELFRAANCNYIRTSHYPPSEEFLDAADELGLFVEDESAICWVGHNANQIWKTWDPADPKFLPYLLLANFEKMSIGRDHPCVILWSMANESVWTPLWAEVQKRVEALDPSRPTSFHDQCWGDYNNAGSTAAIGVYHYPGLNGPASCDKEKRPILFGEYAHIECYNRRELATDPGIRDDWGRPFEKMVDNIQHHDGCLGGAIWAAIDDIFHLPDGQIVGYGPWGIIDGWRREKPEYWQVKNAYSPVRLTDRHAALPGGVTHLEIAVENRFNFTNLSECRIAWQLGNDHGVVTANIPARSTGKLDIQLPRSTVTGEQLRLDVADPRDFICESDALNIGASPAIKTTTPEASSPPPVLSQTDKFIDVTTDTSIVHLQRESGAFTMKTKDGRPVVTSLGLMILPLNTATGGTGGKAGNDYQNHIEPFTPICAGWQLKSLDARVQEGHVVIQLAGSYDQAVGAYTFTISGDGQIELAYHFDVTKALNPRQWGVVLDTPGAYETLKWNRTAQWTIYPADHIARPIGTANANAAQQEGLEVPRRRPAGTWSADATRLGSNDFRSTKYHITAASLVDATGTGIDVRSDGTASIRCWLNAGRVRMLLAGFHTGGSDGFSAALFNSERQKLSPGGRAVDGKISLTIQTRPEAK